MLIADMVCKELVKARKHAADSLTNNMLLEAEEYFKNIYNDNKLNNDQLIYIAAKILLKL